MYLCKIMERKNKSANTRLADDYLPLVVPPICWGSANTFFERSHIYAALTEWHKLDGRIRNKKKLTHLNLKLRKTPFSRLL